MRKNIFSDSLFSIIGGTMGALLIGAIFVTMSYVLAAPTAPPPGGNPPFPQDGAEGPAGPAGADGSLEVIAVHSQSTTTPTCPSGWNELWTGHSYLGSTNAGDHYGNTDLGSPGSCLEGSFGSTSPFVECWENNTNCNASTSDDLSYWLVAGASPDPNFTGSSASACRNYVSRCAVCEKPTTVVVRHSRSSSIPSCPTGYQSMWTGYSLVGGAGGGGLNSLGHDLSSVGSCLQTFHKIPFMEAWNVNNCNYVTNGDSAIWLQADSGSNASRCNVCERI